MDELNDMQNTVHEYRKALDAFARRTGAPTQTVEVRGSGEEREKIARMDADLSAIEERAQLQSLQARLAKLEAQPMFESRAPKATQLGDANDRSSEVYAQRWLNAVVRGDNAEMRALSTGTSGAAIPTDLERRIVSKLREANVLRSMCPISTIDSKRTISVENALPTTSIVAEAGAISATDPSFSTQISVAPRKFVTRVTMSQEFIEDAIGNGGIGSGLQYVADKCGLSIGLKQEEMYTVGDPAAATPQPQGIAHSSALAAFGTNYVDLGTSAALTTLTGDNLIDTVHKVAPAYRQSPRFSWLISDELLKVVRKIKTTSTSNEYVWRPVEGGLGLTGGAPGTIYGVPYRIGQYVPIVGSSNDTVYAVVGDFNYFEIFDRTGITSMMDPYSGAANHQVNMYVYTRTDSKVMNGSAFAAIIS
jgi:HK97 family phage major capsid protein